MHTGLVCQVQARPESTTFTQPLCKIKCLSCSHKLWTAPVMGVLC